MGRFTTIEVNGRQVKAYGNLILHLVQIHCVLQLLVDPRIRYSHEIFFANLVLDTTGAYQDCYNARTCPRKCHHSRTGL